MHMTIRTKLMGLTGFMLVVLLVLGAVEFRATSLAAQGLQRLLITHEALSNHQVADMMHDALRGDVLAALSAETVEEHAEVSASIKDHAATFREQISTNLGLQVDDQVRSALDQVKTPVETYIAAAEAMVKLAATDKVAARAGFAGFSRTFTELEDLMANATDSINPRFSIRNYPPAQTVVRSAREGRRFSNGPTRRSATRVDAWRRPV